MARDKGYKTLSDLTRNYDNRWYNHYVSYLTGLVYQLFKWENLPDTIDPRYLETTLHKHGQIAFHYDKLFGYILLQGTPYGKVNHYNVMSQFKATTPTVENITRSFYIYHYLNQNEVLGEDDGRDYGVLIQNNDMGKPTMEAIRLFATDLTELKSVIRTNVLAQKTPVILTMNDTNEMTIKNIYNRIEANTPVIFTNKTVDIDNFKTHMTPAPYVADKLSTLKNLIWNEFMTFLGINNANLEKRERMVDKEVSSNDEQIEASGNIMLKARQEACERINWLYPELNVSVSIRHDVLDQMKAEVFGNGDLHNAPENIG